MKYEKLIQLATGAAIDDSHQCSCIGPQNGEPLCPCLMKNVMIRNGRYILPERDLGLVPKCEHRQSKYIGHGHNYSMFRCDSCGEEYDA